MTSLRFPVVEEAADFVVGLTASSEIHVRLVLLLEAETMAE